MDTREIPRSGWIEFLDAFSRRHEGSIVDVEVLGKVGAQKEASERPLEGVSSEHGGKRIAIALGPRAHLMEHIIQTPSHLRVLEHQGDAVSLQIESADGETTLLSLREPVGTKAAESVSSAGADDPQAPRTAGPAAHSVKEES